MPRSKPQLPGFSHLDSRGRARMVDVAVKPVSRRIAVAEGIVQISAELERAIRAHTLAKGNLIETARLAGITAAKRTAEWIPLCHNLPLDAIDVQIELQSGHVAVRAVVRSTGRTGVEMEALTAVSAAALTVIDMGKAIDRGMVIEKVRLLEKTGGVHGDWHAAKAEDQRPPARSASPYRPSGTAARTGRRRAPAARP